MGWYKPYLAAGLGITVSKETQMGGERRS